MRPPVAVAVPVEKPTHHLFRRRHNLRKPECLRLAPRSALRHTEPLAQLVGDVARHGPDTEHRDVAPEKGGRYGDGFDLRRTPGERLGQHRAVLLCERLLLDDETDTPTVLDTS